MGSGRGPVYLYTHENSQLTRKVFVRQLVCDGHATFARTSCDVRLARTSCDVRTTFVRMSHERRENSLRMHCELATRLRLVCEFWAIKSQISCKPVAIQKICESGRKKSVKIRMFFAIFRRKFIAQCRSSVRYGLNQYAARSQRFKEVMKSMMHTSNFYLPHFMFFFCCEYFDPAFPGPASWLPNTQ